MLNSKDSLNNFFKGKDILITGITGFKGSWLSIWLLNLGANVYGLALDPPSEPSLFKSSDLLQKIKYKKIDIRNFDDVKNYFLKVNPDFVFHLAAQSLVKTSYEDPLKTWHTNLMGTVHVLESLRILNKKCISLIITSDKCYENNEWCWGYRETDNLGGADPYSGSKGSAELAFSSYYRSFFADNNNTFLCSARAGNVIGGGDWASNRIVPDCIKSWTQKRPVELRDPKATRPWQHVLEPLSGYLRIAQLLSSRANIDGHAFNFGPSLNFEYTVEDVVKRLSSKWPNSKYFCDKKEVNQEKESKLLRLNCDKALSLLKWRPTLNFEETIEYTGNWYFNYYNSNEEFIPIEFCSQQIENFSKLSKERGNLWI